MGVLRVSEQPHRRLVLLGLLLTLAGLVVVAVGVQMLAGLPAGLIAYGAAAVITGLATVTLWA